MLPRQGAEWKRATPEATWFKHIFQLSVRLWRELRLADGHRLWSRRATDPAHLRDYALNTQKNFAALRAVLALRVHSLFGLCALD
jgi:hypothetical protein